MADKEFINYMCVFTDYIFIICNEVIEKTSTYNLEEELSSSAVKGGHLLSLEEGYVNSPFLSL